MKIKDDLVLHGMTRLASDEIEYIPLVHYKLATVTHMDIIFLDGQLMNIPYRENIHVMHSILQL